ncbi:hypothetical protein ACPCAJ_02020 [Streptomyces griseoincarnatus]
MADELRQLVGKRRQELNLSYHSLAVACTAAETGATVSTGWLHRLERGAPIVAPSEEVLAALAVALQLELASLQEAAAAQFFGLRTQWDASGEAAEALAMLATLPERQRRALLDLIRVLAKAH